MAHRQNDSVSMDFLRALVGQFGPNFTVQSDVGLWRRGGSLAELDYKQGLLLQVIYPFVMKYFECPHYKSCANMKYRYNRTGSASKAKYNCYVPFTFFVSGMVTTFTNFFHDNCYG